LTGRILFVDDDLGIRETLPPILALHGFEVTVAATVAEALAEIGSQHFDVLISDLNIGEPGDGFTVVSAMRRTQPKCLTYILTGYPAFETALQAIRSQVDDYLIKPIGPTESINAIEQGLKMPQRGSQPLVASKRISEIIKQNIGRIVQRTLAAIKLEPALGALPLTDEQLIFPFAPVLAELAAMLESPDPDATSTKSMQSAAMRGHIRRLQGYTIPQLVASLRFLANTIYDVIDESLLALDISFVLRDIRRLSNSLILQLQETTGSYLGTRERGLEFESSTKWTGWVCSRCCWNHQQSASDGERAALAASINAEFNAHDCELFARKSWKEILSAYHHGEGGNGVGGSP
jgi:ActR/RegA family two-component response regulator